MNVRAYLTVTSGVQQMFNVCDQLKISSEDNSDALKNGNVLWSAAMR
jgi:hypothetical protein